jgi:membrane fusion protein, multidrug efflux system
LLSACAGLAVLILSIASCGDNKSTTSAAPVTTPVCEVGSDNVQTHREFVASIQARQNVELRAKVEGYLERILVDEGSTVRKDQLLFELRSDEFKARLEHAQADRKSAEAEAKAVQVELERVRQLVEKKIVSPTDLDLAQAKVDMAKARIEQARAVEQEAAIQLSLTQVRAPFDGIIHRLPNKPGSLISAGTLLTTLSDLNEVYAYFNVSETEYLDFFRPGQSDSLMNNRITLELADGTVYPLSGRIETMSSEFDQNTGALALRATFANPDQLLRHGSTGKIRINEVLNNALVIPQTAVVEIQDKNFVFVVDEKNTVTMRSFVPFVRQDNYYVVKSGLYIGERIVKEGVQNIREGSLIEPEMVQSVQLVAKK